MDRVIVQADKYNVDDTEYATKPVVISDDYTLLKPDIDENKVLDKAEAEVVEFSLKKNGAMLIHTQLKPVKNDYTDNHNRGSVAYTETCRNYSYHKVVVPDGTTIKNTNFTQRMTNTQAIYGKNITFIDCNLINNTIDPKWKLEGCNTAQIDLVARELAEKEALKKLEGVK